MLSEYINCLKQLFKLFNVITALEPSKQCYSTAITTKCSLGIYCALFTDAGATGTIN